MGKSIAVFCASAEGNNSIYMEAAYQVGKKIAERGDQLVYGGASVGCMGAVAKGAMDSGGHVIGVLPHFLNKREIAANHISELIMVESMHERKLMMNELSDASISLPGGFGTLEELFEIITWGQLALHQKPTAILNVNGYYNHLQQQLNHMCKEGLLQQKYLDMLLIENSLEELFQKIENYKHPETEQWLTKNKT